MSSFPTVDSGSPRGSGPYWPFSHEVPRIPERGPLPPVLAPRDEPTEQPDFRPLENPAGRQWQPVDGVMIDQGNH